jgi:hypothetical protein
MAKKKGAKITKSKTSTKSSFLPPISSLAGFALVDKMNRFSTADKLNRSRPATVTNGPRTRTRSGSTDGGQQSYKDQLLSVILQQNSANTSVFFHGIGKRFVGIHTVFPLFIPRAPFFHSLHLCPRLEVILAGER